MGLARGTTLKCYTSVAKRLKLKVRRFCWLSSTFVEVTGEKLVRGGIFLPPLRSPIRISVKITFSFFIVLVTVSNSI